MTKTSKHVTIFEGIEGSGKSTLAHRFAEETDAIYQHCGPWLGDDDTSMPRRFAEAMMPAVLGHKNVVLDRSWISEAVYAQIYRKTHGTRVGLINSRILDRLAMRCGAVVIHCDPPIGAVKSVHTTRGDTRISEEDLEKGYRLFKLECTMAVLPVIPYDYIHDTWDGIPDFIRPPVHGLGAESVGYLGAKILIVVDDYDLMPGSKTDPRRVDPTYHITAGSFDPWSWSNTLAGMLESHGISEDELLWVTSRGTSADALRHLSNGIDSVIALGDGAAMSLRAAGIEPDDIFPSPPLLRSMDGGLDRIATDAIEPVLFPEGVD